MIHSCLRSRCRSGRHDARAAIDWVQEHVMHQGDQSNESAAEQFKDEQISDAIRMAYKQISGHELPVADK